MPEPAAPLASAITQPQPVLVDSAPNGRAPSRAPAPTGGQRRLPASPSGMRDALIAGALVMAAAGSARITQLRKVMRRDRRQPHAG
jgi:hypothetical protein